MMTATQCPSVAELKALALGEKPSEDSDYLFQHVNDCESCRCHLETLEDTGDSLIASLRDTAEDGEFSAEPDCRLAVAKALGALANPVKIDESDWQIPKSLGEYDIERPIGSGGMGHVYLARHTKLGREVALKLVARHRLADPRVSQRFEAEMRAVGRLSHPNIVTAHDAREVDGTAVLVTEYVKGMDLGQLLRRIPQLAIADACEIGRQIAVALSYTHAQGFVHRDIKPSNVMLSEEGHVKLLDLGLARFQYDHADRLEITTAGQAMGTADYISPEQVADSKSVDIRSDIYALGCTLFKLLTGRAPFADENHTTAFAKMTAHVSKKPQSLAEVLPSAPRELTQLVDRMLAKDPNSRPQLPAEIVDKLKPFSTSSSLLALITRASTIQEVCPLTQTVEHPPSLAASQYSMQRNVPRWVAIAAGVLGILAGICMSIIVVITNPDGTRSFLELAEGSRIEIRQSESNTGADGSSDVSNSGPGRPPANAAIEGTKAESGKQLDLPMPLAFAVLLNRDSTLRQPFVTESQIFEATEVLRASKGTEPIPTPVGTWYPIAGEDLSAPIKAQNAGVTYVLASNQHFIPWSSVKGHVLGTQYQSFSKSGSSEIQVRLDDELGASLGALTGANLRSQLAIIVHGQARAAPIINSSVGKDVVISGVFSTGEARQLSEWLHGGLVNPPPRLSPNSGNPQESKVPERLDSTSSADNAAQFEVIALESLDPRLAVASLEKFLGNPQGSKPIIDADLSSSRVLIRGTVQQIAQAKKIIQELERQAGDGRSPTTPTTKAEVDERITLLQNNLRKIGLAFHNFESAHKKFPGTANVREGRRASESGGKIYPFSWQVAVLPFIDETALFEQYHFDEPWDSESNLKLLNQMPELYRSPFASDNQDVGEANILGFANKSSALGTAGGEAIRTFTHGTSNTLLLIEAECTVPWTRPQDIPDGIEAAELFDDHPLTCLMADGRVINVEEYDVDAINKMITRNDENFENPFQ
ncbi:MAG: protein kinase [Planctomycetales bacterium]|nr:protein kinase [Planctomycetales bacterium]